MVDVRITLAGLWVAVMLTYLLGDVLRIFAGDYVAGELAGKPATQGLWLLIAVLMLIPIVMVVTCLTLPYAIARWAALIAAVFLVLFNVFGLPYKGAYDNFLIVVSLVWCALIAWYAWTWPVTG
jgi:hypothetical protein